jgi:hypothetical protein
MDELRLDGNAAAGALGEVFSFEVTTAEYACDGCGRYDRIGGAMVYEVRELGTIVRCPHCDNALIRWPTTAAGTSSTSEGRDILQPDSLRERIGQPLDERELGGSVSQHGAKVQLQGLGFSGPTRP